MPFGAQKFEIANSAGLICVEKRCRNKSVVGVFCEPPSCNVGKPLKKIEA